MPDNAKNKSSIVILIIIALVIFGVLGYGIYQNYPKSKNSTPDEIHTTQIATTQVQTTMQNTTVVPTTIVPTTAEPTTVAPTTIEVTTVQPTTKAEINKEDVYQAYLETKGNSRDMIIVPHNMPVRFFMIVLESILSIYILLFIN